MNPQHAQPLRSYHVRVINRASRQTVREFEAMAADSCACAMQHADLAEPGEKLDVMSLDAWRESLGAKQ